MRQSVTRLNVERPASRASRSTRPPSSWLASASVTPKPRSPAARAASRPAGPAPTIKRSLGSSSPCNEGAAGTGLGSMCSGCHPRRHSSPIVGFCVHLIGTPCASLMTQILQPMHSRISSSRPSAILRGRNGSAIDGRAAPMKSAFPLRMRATIRSGDV